MAVADPVVLLNAVAEGGKSLNEVINMFKDTFVKPLMAEVKFHTSRIDTGLDGLTDGGKVTVTRAMQALERVEVEVAGVQIILKELAHTTINQSTTLRRIIEKLNKEDPDDKTMKKLGYLAKYMIKLLQVSERSLDEAKAKYDAALIDLANCKGELTAFKNAVVNLGNEEGERFNAWVHEKRAIVYGTTWIGGPIAIGIAAAILETEIAKYRDRVKAVETAVINAKNQTEGVLNDAGSKINSINHEKTLIVQWRSKIDELAVAFADEESLIDHVTWLGEKEAVVSMMQNLETACQNYIDFVDKE